MQRFFWVIGLLLSWGAVGWVQCQRPLTTFASLKPETRYVGDATCQSCHKQIFASYKETGMGRSLYRPDTSEIIERFGPAETVYDPRKDFHYHVFWKGNEMFMREFRLAGNDTVHQRVEQVDFIVGSGHQTRSYLMQRNGYLYELPITWYVYRKIWDLSPGYEENNSRFDRPIGEECLACHTGAFDMVPESQNKYTRMDMGIDCERCHGPGSEHVRLTREGQLIDVGVETDYSIVNPAKLPVDKQFDVCQQCHLQGVAVPGKPDGSVRDFRPGMALTDVFDVSLEVAEDPEAFGIASHAERLKQSACFIRSEGKLTCTTCHDPHKPVTSLGPAYFNRSCQACHTDQKGPVCTETEAARMLKANDCAGCHMPAGGTRDIPHVWFHDHKIRVVRALSAEETAQKQQFIRLVSGARPVAPAPVAGEAWLRYYERHERKGEYLREAEKLIPSGDYPNQALLAYFQGRYSEALALNSQALAAAPQRLSLMLLQGEIREAMGDFEEAYAAYEKAWLSHPSATEAGFKAAVCLLKARRGQKGVLETAENRFKELLAEKPFDVRFLANLAFVELNLGKLRPAEANLARALSLDPDYPVALETMTQLQIMKGNATQARLYLERLRRADGSHPALMRLSAQAGSMIQ